MSQTSTYLSSPILRELAPYHIIQHNHYTLPSSPSNSSSTSSSPQYPHPVTYTSCLPLPPRPPDQHLFQLRLLHRLGEIVIHARFMALLAVTLDGGSRH